MTKLLIGTTNQAKFDEYKKLLQEFDLDLVTLKDLDLDPPEEPADTFEGNAVHKAKYYYEQTGLPTLVDDGGFEIDALNGEPGVKSHRWLGRESTDEELIAETMKRMKDVPENGRKCRLNLVIALATAFGIVTSDAHIAGVVGKEPSSKRIKGFPFRSVMRLPGYNKYYCDLSEEEHDILNHRKAAIDKIKDIFRELTNK